MLPALSIKPRYRPPLDPGFVPLSLWNRAYRERAGDAARPRSLSLALERSEGSVSVYTTPVLPHEGENADLNNCYVERLLKFLLWQKGGYRIKVAGEPGIAEYLRSAYSANGSRAFDHTFMGERVYGRPVTVESCGLEEAPEEHETSAPLGRHLDGFRIGFDLGASSRKSAAVANGEVVFSEETPWTPSAQADPQYHVDGIQNSLRRAAAHLPRVDAIGGSAAGIYVRNEIRVGSLYRSVPQGVFDVRVRRLFFDLRRAWGGVPFDVVNDGEVTALAGSMAVDDGAVLGISMGTSVAAGYVTPQGAVTNWLNELAFAPVDLRADAPVDEWSGDRGVGVQYFSQQAVNRLLKPAGIDLGEMPIAVKVERVRELMTRGDLRARLIYETIGVYFGYTLGQFADFYECRHLLALGGVLSGEGGSIILNTARQVLEAEFPETAAKIRFHIPDEKEKRHGQAIAAASLPALPDSGGKAEPKRN
jgi:predicted NBD/HSP70 family sugar kinase